MEPRHGDASRNAPGDATEQATKTARMNAPGGDSEQDARTHGDGLAETEHGRVKPVRTDGDHAGVRSMRLADCLDADAHGQVAATGPAAWRRIGRVR